MLTVASNPVCLCVCVFSATEVCHSGRTTLIALRCDPESHGDLASHPAYKLSPRCVDGTCDGCNFVFVITSQAACPVCNETDFTTYKTRCVNGQRSIITESVTYVCLSVCLID